MQKKYWLLLLTGWLLLIIACPPSPAGDPPIGELPVVEITAQVNGLAVELSWVNPVNLAGFDVYRQEGDGTFALVANVPENRNSYIDIACAYNTPLVYYLVLYPGAGKILTSLKSGCVQVSFTPPAVTGVKASRLRYNDRIHITWTAVAGADRYLVYRYTAKTEADRECAFETTTNVFEDKAGSAEGAISGRIYYYRVACAMYNAVFVPSVNFIEGIYSSCIDEFEPNDDKLQAVAIGSHQVAASLYSFNRGAAQDVDWYKYTGSETFLNIVVNLPGGSPLEGYAILEIDGGSKRELIAGANSLDYTGQVPFKIYFMVPDPVWDGIAEYEVKVESL